MNEILDECLNDLASRIDEAQEQRKHKEWESFLDGNCRDEIFVPSKREPSPAKVEWPSVSMNRAFDDFDAMLLHQFRGMSDHLVVGGGSPLVVRCNYGSSIIPSLFGVDLFMMAEDQNTLPTSHPLQSSDAIRKLVDAGLPDVQSFLGSKVFEAAGLFLEALEKYPVLQRNMDLYHPDTQGPIDIAEVVWGSNMFYAFGDEPELVNEFMHLATNTYIAFLRRWFNMVPRTRDWSYHWTMAHKGSVMLRNDSLMNLSPEIYTEFVRPFDQRILDEFGGGAIHFCGRGDHFIEAMSQMQGLHAINVAQPHLNNMTAIFSSTVDKQIKLVGIPRSGVESADRSLRGQVQSS